MKTTDFFIVLITGIVIGIVAVSIFFLFVACPLNKETSYKQGQIDALIGKVKYELVTQPDSTRTWEEINEESPIQ